ncbi:MAG: hypothetical protein LBE59_12005 [Nevskiaceae bacterium]|nr:hypothetical protein [Nevskiaceae bacterium]
MLAAWLIGVVAAPLAAAAETAQGDEATLITQSQIDAATETVKADPALGIERTVRALRWISDEDEQDGNEQDARERPSGFSRWIAQMFRWMAEGGRYLVWVVLALLVGLLSLYLVRFFRGFDSGKSQRAKDAPTHVRNLDIRPESLPEDIGAAAWGLWEQGDHRDALSLLYRGLLSRLVHEHSVPIRDSSTEGDCLNLAERHLSMDRRGYVALLIRAWQRAVYGAENPQGVEMRALCEQFAAALRPVVVPETGP